MWGSPFRELATVARSYRGVTIVSGTQTDQDLWDLAVAGESIAFGELFERHHKAVYNYCFRRTSSWDMAEDLTSQVFLETWRGRQGTALTIDSLLPWLLGVASRLTSTERRTRARRLARDRRLSDPETTPDQADGVVERVDDERRMALVLDAIHHLSREDQDVLSLCVFLLRLDRWARNGPAPSPGTRQNGRPVARLGFGRIGAAVNSAIGCTAVRSYQEA